MPCTQQTQYPQKRRVAFTKTYRHIGHLRYYEIVPGLTNLLQMTVPCIFYLITIYNVPTFLIVCANILKIHNQRIRKQCIQNDMAQNQNNYEIIIKMVLYVRCNDKFVQQKVNINKIKKLMIQRLNYYSRYNRIKNHQDIKSLYQFIIDFDFVGAIDDTHVFKISKKPFEVQQVQENQLSPIKNFTRQAMINRSDFNSQHKRHSSHDPFISQNNRRETVIFSKRDISENKIRLKEEEEKQQQKNNEQCQRTQSARNPTNLQQMNCLQTQSIGHEGESQSDQFSECQPAHFPLISSQRQHIIQSQSQQNDEDNFSSVRLNNLFDLRKNSLDGHELIEKVFQHSKSERLQRVHCSDIEIQSSNSRYDYQNFETNNEYEEKVGQNQKQNQSIQQQYNQYAEEDGEDMFEDSVVKSSNFNDQILEIDMQKVVSETQQKPQSISEQQNSLIYCKSSYSNEEQNQEIIFRSRKNQLQNMHFGYETNKQEMRIGYENYPPQKHTDLNNESGQYTPQQISESIKSMKIQLNKEKINNSQALWSESIKSNENWNQLEVQKQKQKAPISERKPFKKFMMNKKLNPRMATSTIVNDLGDKKPKKVNFKKMLTKEKSENKIKFDDLVVSRKLSGKKTETNKQKKKLLQAFFDQN